jgi:hypothetical protein
MPTELSVTIPSGDVTLEGALAAASLGAPAVVICHPHPDYGGSMENNVVYAVRDVAISLGLTVLRFNFRGVGDSGGRSTGELLDARDVGAAVDFIAGGEAKPKTIYLVGYSYGAWVGLFHAVSDARIAGWVGISPPTGLLDFSYLVESPVPKLIVTGDADYFVSMDDLKKIYNRLAKPKRFATIKGADHFYWGHEKLLKKEVETFFREATARAPA